MKPHSTFKLERIVGTQGIGAFVAGWARAWVNFAVQLPHVPQYLRPSPPMSIYVNELPTTGAICFADFCVDQSPEGTYAAHLAEAAQARADPRGVLKVGKRTDRNDKDYPESSRSWRSISRSLFSWRMTLSACMFNASPRLALPSLHYDLAASLLTYAFALSNLASALITTCGCSAVGVGVGVAEAARGDERLGFAVNQLLSAAGGRSRRRRSLRGSARAGGPTLAAQSLPVRKPLARSTADAPVAPGPPLPQSQPSPAFLAKLHLECAAAPVRVVEGAGSATLLLASKFSKGSGSGSGAGAGGEITPVLKHHLFAHTALHTALAHIWLGADAGEGEHAGDAVGFLAWAHRGLEELHGGG
ncbi:hypothetical protein BV22DRAFT_1187593 [Leucogyrophana mollusca]|uniref:Uncharacterized protein n=1 Tax=Leucogyrophana mollusca TaxID=85980 RepID=A0ACB8AWE8_9AGAM|nr:hypothetical protein BV22DRAFT_1187593 [Leucogyrophana mollusca]